MKDISQMEREFEEYERNIQRLKQLERELNSLNSEGLEADTNAIKSKLKDPKKAEEVEKEFHELKEKIKEKNIKRKVAEQKHQQAQNEIHNAKAVIEKVEKFGCNPFEAKDLLDDAERALYLENYDEAIRSAKEAEKVAEEIKQKSRPEIGVQLSKDTFQRGIWTDVLLQISNKGKASAYDIKLDFSEEVKAKGLETIGSLGVGEKMELDVSFKPVDAGKRVPLEISVQFRDGEGKRYKETEAVDLNVEEVWREIFKEEPTESVKPSGVEIQREYEFFSGFIRLKMAVTNPMSQIITDVSLDLDFDENTLLLDRHEPNYELKGDKVLLRDISPGTSKSVTFYLDPMTCTKGTEINCRVGYKDAYGKPKSTQMAPKKVEVVCPIFHTVNDINIGMLKDFIKNLPWQDHKFYTIPEGLDAKKAIELCRETIQMHDVRHIRTLRTKDDKTCETWYYGKTKVDENDVVINGRTNEETKSIEIFAATPTPKSLTGLLAELGDNLTKKITEAGMKYQYIVNVSIKDTIIQRSNLLNFCGMDGVCSDNNIVIEESVIQRSNIGVVSKTS